MAGRKFRTDVELRGNTKGVKKAFTKAGSAADGLTKKLKGIGIAAATLAVGKVFLGAADKIREFEKSISDLSAITGATGADLDKLEKASKKIGQTTTLSASQAATAFKLMASAKPDLLENLDALEATTAAAVTLAEAAGIELPAAADALGESLNQFGESADSADRFINILAAGSKFGASAIESTSEALRNAGVVAKLAGLSFEETNAAIQAMAFAGVKGSDAGTKLRSVLIKLQTQANDDFNPAIVGMSTALKNLEEANLSTTEKVEIFGEKQVVSAEILIAQRENYDKLTKKLDGTNTAFEQAATRTDNLDGSLKRMGSAYEALQLSFSNSLPVFKAVIDAFTDILNALASVNSEDEGAVGAANSFSILGATLKTLAVSANVAKNIFDGLVDILGFVGRAFVAIATRDADLLVVAFDNLKKDLASQAEDVGEFAFRTFNAEGAAKLDANMEEFYKKPIVAKAVETAEAVAAVATPETAGEQAARELAEKHITELDAKLERIRVSNLTELEIEGEAWSERIAVLQEGLELKRITQEEFDKELVGAAERVAKRIAAIQAKTAKTDLTFATMTAKQKTKAIIGEAVNLTSGVAQQSKTMFKINKVAGIANAVVNTAQSITEMMKLPWPLNLAMAALAAASGAAQIAAIKSTTFSGGGGGTSPSLAGSAGTINSVPVGGAGAPEQPLGIPGSSASSGGGQAQRIDINIEGLDDAGILPASAVRDLIASIDEELGEGVSLNVSGGG